MSEIPSTFSPQRIFLHTEERMGDLILSWPTLVCLNKSFNHADWLVSTQPKYREFFQETFQRVEFIAPEYIRSEESIIPFQRRRLDLAVMLCRYLELNYKRALENVPITAGLSAKGYNHWLSNAYAPLPELEWVHLGAFYSRMISTLFGFSPDLKSCSLRINEERRLEQQQWLCGRRTQHEKPLVAIGITSSEIEKDWDRASYLQLLSLLSLRYECLLLAAPGKAEIAFDLAQHSVCKVIVEPGCTGPMELAALISCCQAFVGVDSGPMHVAGVLGLPTVGLFLKNPPWKYGPFGQFAMCLTTVKDPPLHPEYLNFKVSERIFPPDLVQELNHLVFIRERVI